MSDSERPEDEKFAEEFAYVFGAFPKDQAAELLIRRQKELRAACYRHAASVAREKSATVINGPAEATAVELVRLAAEIERGQS